MYLACVELAARGISCGGESRVVQLQFSRLETARIWARAESSRNRGATGNAAVFQTLGPLMSLAWECEAVETSPNLHETRPIAYDALV